MVSRACIKHRAVMMGIATGDMPEVALIWAVQRREGSNECFGQGLGCKKKECSWRRACVALDFYADVRLPIGQGTACRGQQGPRFAEKTKRTAGFVERVLAVAGKLEPVPTVSGVS